MFEDLSFEKERKIRGDLTLAFRQSIDNCMGKLRFSMDEEITQEIRERIAAFLIAELVNEMPVVPYLSVWQEGSAEIFHAYMSPKIKQLCGYSPSELAQIGYNNIVRGDIIRFFRQQDGTSEAEKSISEARQKRVTGFMDTRSWEGCYKIEKKNGQQAWVIDRATITRFRNIIKGNIICLSSGILLETTELIET